MFCHTVFQNTRINRYLKFCIVISNIAGDMYCRHQRLFCNNEAFKPKIHRLIKLLTKARGKQSSCKSSSSFTHLLTTYFSIASMFVFKIIFIQMIIHNVKEAVFHHMKL